MLATNLRNALLFSCFIILLAACKSNDQSFTVVGNIQGMPPQRVRLQELTIKDTIIIADSATVDADGKFELHAQTTQPGLYQVIFEQGKYLLLSSDGNNINVSGTWADLSNAQFTGSNPTLELNQFIRRIERSLVDVRSIGMVIDSMQARGNDSLLNKAMADARAINQDITRMVEQYADTTKYLPNALFAVRILNPSTEKDYLNNFVQRLGQRFPKEPQAAEFATAYRQMMAGPQTPAGPAMTGEPLVGAMAPDISATSPDGKTISLSDYKGKYVLVDFWASWCRPCRVENPNVVKAWNKYKDRNFEILGVSLDEDKAAWTQAIAKDNLTWAHMSDLQGWESIPARTYQVNSIPANFLIDPTGKIISSNLRGDELDARLGELLR